MFPSTFSHVDYSKIKQYSSSIKWIVILITLFVILLTPFQELYLQAQEYRKGIFLDPKQVGLSIELKATKYHVKSGETFSLFGTVSNLTNRSRTVMITVYSTDYGGSKVISREPPIGNVLLPPLEKIPFNITLEAQKAGNYTFGIVVFTSEGPAGSELLVIEVKEDLLYRLQMNLPLIIIVTFSAFIFAFKPSREKIKGMLIFGYNKLSYDVYSLNKKEATWHVAIFLVLFSILFFPYFLSILISILLHFLPRPLPEVPPLLGILFLAGYKLIILLGIPLISFFYGKRFKKPFLCSVVTFTPFLLQTFLYVVEDIIVFRIIPSFFVIFYSLSFGFLFTLVTLGASLKNRKIGTLLLIIFLIFWLYLAYQVLPHLFSIE